MTPLCVCAQVRLGECQLRICRDDWNSSAHHISVAAREDALLNTDQLLALDIRAAARTPAPPPKTWRLVQPPFPPMTHTSVSTFDWKLLLDKDSN